MMRRCGLHLKNSLFFTVFSAITQQVLGLLLAVLLTNINKGRNLFKNIYYLPCVLSSAALGLLWAFLFNPRMGIDIQSCTVWHSGTDVAG